MKGAILDRESMAVSVPAARLAFAAAILTLVLIASLHVLSPEFDPSWRMVSEYANGRYGWVLSLMFASWALSSWALPFAIRAQVRTRVGKIGLAFLVAAGVGEAMGSVFDINHEPLHDIAGYIGILSLPIAAMLLSVCLGRTWEWPRGKKVLLWAANLTWASVVLLAASLIAMGVSFLRAGGHVPADGKSLPLRTRLPHGVIPVAGYANRFLVLAYCWWALVVAWQATRLTRKQHAGHNRAALADSEETLP
jgi:hypothetical membrane protein